MMFLSRHAPALLAALLIAAPAVAADFTMKIGTPTLNDIQHEWMKRAEPRFEEASGGRIDVELYPSGQIGSVPRMIEGLQFGTLEGLSAPSFFLSGLEKRNSVLAAAGLFRDLEHCRAVTSDPEFREVFFAVNDALGIKTVAILCSASQAMLTKKPIEKLEDLAGLKIRVLASPFEIAPMKAIGANPTPMPLGEVAPALERGVIDGVSSLPIIFANFKMETIAKYITTTNLSQFAVPVYVSKPWFDSLPDDLQKVILDESVVIEKELYDWTDEKNEAALAAWKERGGLIADLPEDQEKLLLEKTDAATQQVLADDADLAAFYGKLKEIAAKY